MLESVSEFEVANANANIQPRAILYTTALAILSLLYLTIFVAYYKPLAKHASTFAVNFSLGVAWAVALIAEVLDPNNTWPNELSKFTYPGHEGESVHNYRARVALSGITASMLLTMSLAGGLRVLGIGGGGNSRQRQDWESEGSIEMGEGRVPTPIESQREESPRPPQQQQGQRNTFMLVLARVGIFKNRSVVSERSV